MHFNCKKLYWWPETGTRMLWGFIDPLGAEDVKCTGVENLAGSSTPQSPEIAPCLKFETGSGYTG